MDVPIFRSKIKPGINLIIDDKLYLVKEVVKFRFDDGNFYIKCFLAGGYVFADDLSENSFVLAKEAETDFKIPFPQKLIFDGKEFEFLYSAHAVAEEIDGQEIFKKGDAEKFWDYKSNDGSYLSLGINDGAGDREDYYGEIITGDNIKFK